MKSRTRGITAEERPDEKALDQALQAARQYDTEPTLTSTLLRHSLVAILALLRFCITGQASCFKLPNDNIGASFRVCSPADLPRWEDLETFAPSGAPRLP